MDQSPSKSKPHSSSFSSTSSTKSQKAIKLGICAMEKKVQSKHMQNILKGLSQFEEFEIITFSEDIIFNKDINEWPIVDAMIIFFSDGFPYNKGLKYINLRKPFLINDFETQKLFWDRRKVLETLKANQIPTPPNIIIDRGEEVNNDGEFSHKLNDSLEIENMIQNFKNEIVKSSSTNLGGYDLNDVDYSSLRKNEMSTFSLIDTDINSTPQKNLDFRGNIIEKDEDIIEVCPQSDKTSSINETKTPSTIAGPSTGPDADLLEFDDHIEYKGKKLFKPFVEKPVNGDDHNIYIYYPPSHGGGQKRLFRKTKDLCSLFIPNANSIRRDKSYIYEEFLQTDGFDIKVYTIGPEYAHAEARKSPSLDGKVQRSSEGKEVRYPVNLTPHEKELARKIVNTFKQNVCGFDILRARGHSYVCDINGWSFVKGNKKYYEDCAILIRKMILQQLDQNLFLKNPIYLKKVPIYKALKLPYLQKDSPKYVEELRSVVAVFRHADRSPKQKMKLVVDNMDILSLFEKFGKIEEEEDNSNIVDVDSKVVPHFKEIKLKKPKELMEVLKIVTNILFKNKIDECLLCDINDNFFTKLFQIKMVLEKNLNFEGMTRKIQMKPLKSDFKLIENGKKKKYFVSEALMILKWGGNITHSGIEQARLLGNTFRVQMYPSNLGDGSGLLRLHSTYRHDLKCYSSDEGRCLKTAAAFLQGLLSLEGPMIPIISSMVRKDEPVSQSLDISCEQIPEVKNKIKQEISDCLNKNGELKEKFDSMFEKSTIYQNVESNSNSSKNVINSIESSSHISSYPLYDLMINIGNPYIRMKKIIELMDIIIEHLKSYLSPEEIELECNSYFIKSVTSIQKRTMLKSLKKLSEEAEKYFTSQLDDDNFEEDEYSGIPSPRISTQDVLVKKTKSGKSSFIEGKSHSRGRANNSPSPSQGGMNLMSIQDKKGKEKDIEKNVSSETSSINQVNSSYIKTVHECEDEKIILIFKRYVKLRKDFYNKKTKKFDISKVPDIYDNIKYDIIHNKGLLGEEAYELYSHINLLANFVMPLEYGITIKEKMNIGIKVIGSLLNKIHKDLLWWNYLNPYYPKPKELEETDATFSGLDQSRVDKSEIKSSWRHVKTRFYFTCASHMYALLNLLTYGYDSFLVDRTESNKKGISELRNVFDLDYCSHIVFRLYENFNVPIENPKRFRLEIIMSPGSTKDPKEADQNHMINVSPWIILNNNLTLQQLKEFFCKFVDKENP